MRIIHSVFLVMIILGGCSYPSSEVQVIDSRPKISINNAPVDALVFVDGLKLGVVNDEMGYPKVYLVEPGIHKIQVKDKSKVIYSEKVFLGGNELKKISITESK